MTSTTYTGTNHGLQIGNNHGSVTAELHQYRFDRVSVSKIQQTYTTHSLHHWRHRSILPPRSTLCWLASCEKSIEKEQRTSDVLRQSNRFFKTCNIRNGGTEETPVWVSLVSVLPSAYRRPAHTTSRSRCGCATLERPFSLNSPTSKMMMNLQSWVWRMNNQPGIWGFDDARD